MSAGRVHTETTLAREFWANVVERFYLHTLAFSGERSCDSVNRSGQLHIS